jgi:hypothetical protein
MAGTFGVRGQPPHVVSRGRAYDLEADDDLLEVRGGVVDAVLLGVAKRGADVCRRIVDRDLIERREPRQLGEQSKRGPHHQELKRRCALLGSTTSERLIGLDDELAHPALEVHILDNPSHGSCGDDTVLGPLGAHLRTQAFDVTHLVFEIDAPSPRSRS